jgi:hypothetical protein
MQGLVSRQDVRKFLVLILVKLLDILKVILVFAHGIHFELDPLLLI